MRWKEMCLFCTAIVMLGHVAAGCSSSDDCPSPNGTELTCVDAITGAPIGNAIMVVNSDASQQLGAYCVSTPQDAATAQCIYDGPTVPGTYAITFAAPGYETQTVIDTLTPTGRCGNTTESLRQVSLIPIDLGMMDGG